MKIVQSFEVARPISAVWDLFQDIPTVVTCMPGAELVEDKGNGNYAGRVSIKLGPFAAAFDGDATVTAQPETHSGRIEGRGQDKRGGSRSKLLMDYRLTETGGKTRVAIDADVQLAGPIAQFGRTGVVTETANVLIQQLARNVEAKLQPAGESAALGLADPSPAARSRSGSNQLSVFTVLRLLITSFFKRLAGRNA